MVPKKHEKYMSNDARIAVLETTLLNINTVLLDIKQDMRHGFEKIDHQFEKVDNRLDNIQNRLWSNFLWLISMMIGLAGLIAHTQHWI